MWVMCVSSENSSAKENVEIVYREGGESFQAIIEKLFKQYINTGSYLSDKDGTDDG